MMLQEIDPNFPELVTALLSGFAVLFTAVVGGIVLALKTRHDTKKQLQENKVELKKVTNQVENGHSEQPNLREDIDVLKRNALDAASMAADAKSEAVLAKEATHRSERHLEDIKRSIRALERSNDLTSNIQEKALTNMSQTIKKQEIAIRKIHDVAEVVKDGLQAHLEDVPHILQEWDDKREALQKQEGE